MRAKIVFSIWEYITCLLIPAWYFPFDISITMVLKINLYLLYLSWGKLYGQNTKKRSLSMMTRRTAVKLRAAGRCSWWREVYSYFAVVQDRPPAPLNTRTQRSIVVNMYLAPVHLHSSKLARNVTRGAVASLSRCVVCDVVSALPEDRSISSELSP